MAGTRITLGILVGAVGVFCLTLGLNADPPRTPTNPADKAKGTQKPDDDKRVSLAVARDRAKLMHVMYSATLDSVHHHYFRRDRAVLPARALEDVFAEVDRQTKIKSRWIAVNTPAMSVNHEPETDFEKKAAAEIASGKAEFDRVENGYYHRVGAIPLGTGCVSCHTKFGVTPEKTPRFAGLVISIPLKDE
ncbi:MAG: hypothetical protein C0467_24045 [Planctomycetaceae bacterium]|nr:hypothetical protein [Planctomycetaceae bacterium]